MEYLWEMPQFKHTRHNFVAHNPKTTNSIIQKNLRSPAYIESLIANKKEEQFYLGFGGTGDALLLLAACWNKPKKHAVFFGNGGSIPLITNFFQTFDVPATVVQNIMGKPIANTIFTRLNQTGRLAPSAHLADGLYYEDWKNEEKYISRIINYVPEWKTKFPTLDKKLVVIAPSGSHRTLDRQRFLTRQEYEALARKYLAENYEVFGVGSEHDLKEYLFPGTWWLTNNTICGWHSTTQHTLADMLGIINSASEVLSMDTWVKSYALITGIPTTVIATRWNGEYRQYGEDITDYIFLNKKIWPDIKIAKIEEILK